MDKKVMTRMIALLAIVGAVVFMATRQKNPAVQETPSSASLKAAKSAPAAKMKVQIIGGVQGVQNLNERIEGFQEAAQNDRVEFCKVLYNEENPGKALEDCENALKANPDLKGFFTSNAFGGAGAAKTIDSAIQAGTLKKGDVHIIGFDTTDDILNFMEAGLIDCTLAQNTQLMGRLSIEQLLKFAQERKDKGQFARPEQDIIDTGVTLVYPKDIPQYRHQAPPASSPAEEVPGQMRFALVPKSIGHPYWEGVREGMEQAASELGVKAVFLGPPEASMDEQIRIIEDFIAQGFDGIAISPNDPNAVKDVIKRAMEKGIAVITFDSDSPESERLLYVGTNNREAGRVAGREMLKLVGLAQG